ncbi:MAG: isocitrate lyase/PEP mutase family protein [Micromonosporaceae bacterium]
MRELISVGDPLLLPGAPNALTARIIEEVGYEAVYLSGAGITNTYLGAPDIGLLTMSELVAHVAAVRDAVSIPIVVDADTGFGNALNVQRTVRALERAGANALQMEDQVFPKRCGHFSGKSVIGAEEMVGKIKAALDARDSEDTLIIARTDTGAVLGFEEAYRRAAMYREAGADCVFVEAPPSREILAEIPRRVPGPHVANMVEGGMTPILSREELGAMGYSIILYANTAMRAAMKAMIEALTVLRNEGSSKNLDDAIVSFDQRQKLVRRPMFEELSEKYM